jgi:hypothetical protein
MNRLRSVAWGMALAGVSLGHAEEPPGTTPEQDADDVQIVASANDPAVFEGLPAERVSAQAKHLFHELDHDGSGELLPRDVPPDIALSQRFLEFDLDGDGRIGVTEFEAYFASEHYLEEDGRWFPRLASTGRDAEATGDGRTAAIEDDDPH